MGECFWEQESVVGLANDCSALPSTSLWAYIDLAPESWVPLPGGSYGTVGFPLAGSLAGVTAATLTGVKTARAYRAGSDTGVLVYSTDDPTTVAYDSTSIAAAPEIPYGAETSWMIAGAWPSPPLNPDDSYAVVACRWDTNLGVLYTLSYLSVGV